MRYSGLQGVEKQKHRRELGIRFSHVEGYRVLWTQGGASTFCLGEVVGLHESLGTSAKPLEEFMKPGRAVLAEGTAGQRVGGEKPRQTLGGKGGFLDTADALVFGDMAIR